MMQIDPRTADVITLVVPKKFRWAKSNGTFSPWSERPNMFTLVGPSKEQFKEISEWLTETTGVKVGTVVTGEGEFKPKYLEWDVEFTAETKLKLRFDRSSRDLDKQNGSDVPLYGLIFSVGFTLNPVYQAMFKLRFQEYFP